MLCNWSEIVSGRQYSHHLHLLSLLLCNANKGLVRAGPPPPPTTFCSLSSGETTRPRERLLTAGDSGQNVWSQRKSLAGRCRGAHCIYKTLWQQRSPLLSAKWLHMVTFSEVWEWLERRHTGIFHFTLAVIFQASSPQRHTFCHPIYHKFLRLNNMSPDFFKWFLSFVLELEKNQCHLRAAHDVNKKQQQACISTAQNK